MAMPLAKRLRPTPPTTAPPATSELAAYAAPEVDESAADIMNRPGMFYEETCDCIAISHVPDAAAMMRDWSFKGDERWCQELEATLPGRYWRVSHTFNGRPCWHKEGEAPQPWLFFDKGTEGWVVGVDLAEVTDCTMVAWGPAGSGDWPSKLHLPYWSKKANPMVRYTTMSDSTRFLCPVRSIIGFHVHCSVGGTL